MCVAHFDKFREWCMMQARYDHMDKQEKSMKSIELALKALVSQGDKKLIIEMDDFKSDR